MFDPKPDSPVSSGLSYVAPGACIGVLGGGQLGRMLVQAAQSMGYKTAVLDPDPHCPASPMADHFLCSGYAQDEGLQALGGLVSRVTTEFENVPAHALEHLATRVGVSPSGACVRVAQDRVLEKNTIKRCGLPVAPFHVIESSKDLTSVPHDLFPGILKTARLGYDGKGQVVVNSAMDLQAAYAQLQQGQRDQALTCVLEKKLPLWAECSVILAREPNGQCVHLPIQINQHHHGILFSTTVFPGWVSPQLEEQLQTAAQTLAQSIDYVGVLCVEFFILLSPPNANTPTPQSSTLNWVINEIAPRPHNSGHHSLNSCSMSQFEMQLRVLVGLPLNSIRQHSPCVMLNLLGDLWLDPSPIREHQSTDPVEPDWSRVLALKGTHLHLYGKEKARRARKMGHLNITGSTPEEVESTVAQCLSLLGLGAMGLGVASALHGSVLTPHRETQGNP